MSDLSTFYIFECRTEKDYQAAVRQLKKKKIDIECDPKELTLQAEVEVGGLEGQVIRPLKGLQILVITHRGIERHELARSRKSRLLQVMDWNFFRCDTWQKLDEKVGNRSYAKKKRVRLQELELEGWVDAEW